MHTRACTAGLRPKQTCSNISASAHLQSTKWCLRSNAQGSSADSAASLAVSKCSLIQNTCRSYDEPRSTSQNLCAEVLAEQALEERERIVGLAPLDPAQDFLVALGGGGVAFGIQRRRHVGDAALVAVQDGVDAAIEAVDVVAQHQSAIVHEGGLVG